MKKILFTLSIFLISCQEEITLDIPQAESKIVVEGAIEPGFPPYVILTKNQSYFDPININTLDDIAVGDANVKVWTYNEDGSKDSTILDLLPSPYDSVPLYTDLDIISNPTLAFTGEIGKEISENLYSAVASVLAYIFKIERGEETDYPEFEIPENMSFDEYGKIIK